MFVLRTKNSRTRFRDTRGTALIELALVLPLVMVLLLGMLDFGKAFNAWTDETHLANVGARLAAVNYSVAGRSNANTNICLAHHMQWQPDNQELKSRHAGDSYAPAQNAAQVSISSHATT